MPPQPTAATDPQDQIPRTTPVSGYASAAFILALISPATLGVTGVIAIILAIRAHKDTSLGYRGGHFLTVASLVISVIWILTWMVLFYILAVSMHRQGMEVQP